MNQPFTSLLFESALNHLQRPAFFWKNTHYTYQEFYSIVAGICKKLSSADEERIAIAGSKDVLSSAAVIACVLSGKTYVPLNPSYPRERILQIINQCKLKHYISPAELNLGTLEWIKPENGNPPDIKTTAFSPDSIAYILFTSGTTGVPRGVPVSYGNLQHFFDFFLKEYNFNPADRFLQMYELSFDVSVFCLLMPLLAGASVYFVPDNKPGYIGITEILKDHSITVSSMVPSVLHFLGPYFHELSFPQLRYSFFSGDSLSQRLAEKWSSVVPNAGIHNFYGPTETTIVCSRYCWTKNSKPTANGIVPIGKLFPGMEYMILDENGKALNRDEPGELCLSGPQVISSYLDNAHPEKFIRKNPKTYYRTGDLVSKNKEGELLFHGRSDRQVKINGYRAELAEVEHHISLLSGGKQCAVIKANDGKGDYLLAFIHDHKDTLSLKKKLAEKLPSYMLPEKLISISEMPLNVNGKVDYTRLIKLKS